jgi:alkanesulfonate monooxygenase SsuD/methylene tetrahydromethanopterin reductase-like flavin-dependent oxidoreductase (luciferase family)
MTVRFSTRCPNSDYLGFETSPEAIVAAAKKAEEVGFDAIFVNDHIIVDSSSRAAPWTNVYDPFVAMSFIAAHTTRIGVGVSVLIMPYRNPVATAKSLATIDRMSGGRLIAGVGVGWSEAEFAALGVPFHERGARTNEYLRLWQACWGAGQSLLRREILFVLRDACQPEAGAAAASADLDRRCQRCGAAPSCAVRRAVAADPAARRRAGRAPDRVAPGVRPNRALADPDAHELPRRDQHSHRQCAIVGRQAAGWIRHASRSR